ncbi:MAG: helix-turn-helix transcriptional regulator [Neisseriaceae bacterium]|nr:helix-turn-helix transcriptional regulator [Neisseriaceae bacterium]MBR7002178.1 helix-turn-helix transcriptional regulator [Neisseriaceae bacterium]
MLTHEELKKKMLADDEVRQEYERLNQEEFALLDQFLAARKAAGMTQTAVAEKMGTKTAAVARLESAMLNGKHSPTILTLQKYAQAVGKKLEIRLA